MNLGIVQTLKVSRFVDFGAYLVDLDAQTGGRNPKGSEVLLPKKQVPAEAKENDTIEVFLYKDSEDRMIATTTIPSLSLGTVALLTVKEVSPIGAFLDWGLPKDLLLPFKEQTTKVEVNDEILVSLYIDKSERLCATMKIYEYLRSDAPYQKDDKVEGIVYELSDEFGTFVAVDHIYSALIPKNQLFTKLRPGDKVEARVVSVREDGKLNLSVRDKAYLQLDTDADNIYERLVISGGFLPLNDKSDPELIKDTFNLSKNAFKRAIGRLLKNGKITIEEDGIHKVE
ncbi:MAG TPA: S1-like domain-containing RNA-binding protein [Lachnospiraceae bacterium]|nr:S1-like domain-containing RNA-binding protein [Lachnospiraceae bacterium]